MCGIVGLADFKGVSRKTVAPRLASAMERLARRGPDGEGSFFGPRAAFGHRRLAIVDLSETGAQPMTRGPLTIVHNGMIYNYRALREELEAAGARFRGSSDTEVLLAGWEHWGEAMLPKLTGMFAFAIWDEEAGELVLARDRFGQKPMLYRHRGRRLAFASDLVALQRLEAGAGEVDPAALRLYFTLRYLPEPVSILQGVAKLPPGHLLRFKGAAPELQRWFDLAADRPGRYADHAPAEADLRERFDAAVADRLVADVPVGTFLSGGIDSALVAASLARATDRVRTFTVGFEDAPGYYEERPAARAVARHLGTEHTEIAVSAGDARAVVDEVFDGLDEPFADSSSVPTYLVSRETRGHVTVALSGDGADEVFGGYRKHQGELAARGYQRLPLWLRSGLIEPVAAGLPEGKRSWLLERFRRLRRFTAEAGKDAVGRQAGWARSLSEAELDALLGPAPGGTPSLESMIEDYRTAARDDDPVNQMLAAEIGLGLPGDMLVKVDRMSMANGLEVRSPFLDHRVVACAAAMPGRFKLARGAGKKILRDTFADRLPAEVFRRPKRGFELPVAEWLTGPLRDLVRRSIDRDRLARQGLLRPELPERWLAALESGRRDTAGQLWSVIAFQAWWDRHTGAR